MKTTLPKLKSGATGFYNERNEWQCTGSQMGRPDTLPENRQLPVKLRLVRLKWRDGDYDEGGAYWGFNGCNDVYRAVSTDVEAFGDSLQLVECFVRALGRQDAKAKVLQVLPQARFYR